MYDPDLPAAHGAAHASTRGSVAEVWWLFLRLGFFAFGGPAVHMAMMRDELVRRRGWLDDERFLDLMAATHLVPGPNSTELAIHLGHERAGWKGFAAAGVAFIAPAALMVTAIAWGYDQWHDQTWVGAVLAGVSPVVVAILAHAAWSLVPVAWRTPWLALLGLAGLGLWFVGVPELALLLGGGVVAVAVQAVLARRGSARSHDAWAAPAILLAGTAGSTGGGAERLGELFVTMLKIGAVLYGSGYVLLTFLETEFVDERGWITRQQLLDAVAVGQLTPGPLFTSATFVGFVVAGFAGALLATVAVFAPSFAFVAVLTRVTDRLRAYWWSAAALNGVNAVALALLVAVVISLGREAVTSPVGLALGAVTLLGLLRTRLNSVWFVLLGALTGLLIHYVM